jgi:hypothetical protein
MGNYWSTSDNDVRLSALESRILYLEAQLEKTEFTPSGGDGFEKIDHPQKEKPRVVPTFHNELRKRLEMRRKHLEVPIV